MGPLGYAWIWKWLTICIYYQTLTLLNHPFGGPMIHIIYPSIYSSNFPPKPQPRAHQEMSSLTNDLPSVCFLGLGVLFFTHSCVWHSHGNSWVQISVPHDLWLQAGMATQQKLHSPVPVSQRVPTPAASPPWSAWCDSACQGLGLGRWLWEQLRVSLDGTATKKNDQHLTARKQDIVAH